MIVTKELLEQKAHQAALSHDPYITNERSASFWRDIDRNFTALQQFLDKLYVERSSCRQLAEEWLLDHAEFIAEQTISLKEEARKGLKTKLPFIENNKPRIYAICADYVELVDGRLERDSFMTYLHSYQDVSILTIAEVWSVPFMLRLALLRHLFDMSDHVRERHDTCRKVESVVGRLGPHEMTPEKLKQSLDEEGFQMPLSGPVIVHLVQHLRELADDTAMVGEWLICKLENGPESLDSIVSYEYQLQASYQVTVGNLITSLRDLNRWQWTDSFEKACKVEQTLRTEPTGDYEKLDFDSRNTLRKQVEKLALKMRMPENLVASQAVELAASKVKENDRSSSRMLQREAFIGYYLLEPKGIKALRRALMLCGKPKVLPEIGVMQRAKGTYFNAIAVLFVVAIVLFTAWIGWPQFSTGWLTLLGIALLAVPALEWAVTAVHAFIERVREPVPVLRYDFSPGIPEEAASMVVVPLIWSTVDEVKEYFDRIELHYLANRDRNIHFALLTDYPDANSEQLPEDEMILAAARKQLKRLNDSYPERPFHLLQRSRMWNESEGVWMGWERKRGKLVEFVELVKGKKDTSFSEVIGDSSFLSKVQYIITLDADTVLPLESAKRMIGAMHLPFNKPRLNKKGTRIVEGYGVLQPRIGISLECAQRSKLSALWSADPGVDPYAFAVSDPYQDSFGEGIFTGKGIFDVNAFHRVLCDRIPENRVLSHDLLEGGFLRAGLLSDIELIDEHPAKFVAYQKRQHRWVRGDWQLVLWLLPRVKNRNGMLWPVDLSILTRWQIVDNLRRSLLIPLLLVTMILAVTILPGNPLNWISLVLATLCLPIIRHLVSVRTVVNQPRSVLLAAGQALLSIITLPFQAVMLADAIIRSLYRLLISKRKLLEWTSSAEVERISMQEGTPVMKGLYGGYAVAALFLVAVIFNDSTAVQFTGAVITSLWLIAPVIVRWLDEPVRKPSVTFTETEQKEIRQLAKQIWSFYDDYVTERDNWLPPDNVQIEPHRGAAHRTSPTNIGLYMTSVLAARDFGFIDTAELIERIEKTLDTLDQMETWEGHLYNWYDTETLRPLPPQYVSTVDSGNFVACLMTVKEGIAEWLETTGSDYSDYFEDETEKNETFDVAFAEEISPDQQQKFRSVRDHNKYKWLERGKKLERRIQSWIENTNFRPLYDDAAKLFVVGYQVKQQQRDNVYYDLIASEARQASFVAVALGQISVSHWHALGRTMTKAGRGTTLMSWSGTMFEYLMPWLLMRTHKDTIWERSYQAVVDRQIEYANQRNVPFGISESGYYAFDYQMNYQYKAFGVPGLGFQRGLEQELVVSPYATILAMPFAKEQSLQALRKMERLGARGKYGFYESIDFTTDRLPKGEKHKVVKSFMAHHQGMSMLTLANLLLPYKATDRFHRNKHVRAAELLLQERMPKRPKLIEHPAMRRVHLPYDETVNDVFAVREFEGANTKTPEINVLSNGDFSTIVTNSGSGFMQYKGIAVSRWREDPLQDNWGAYVYIRDLESDQVWSPSYHPCKTVPKEQRVQFLHDKAVFFCKEGDIESTMELCVSPEYDADVRRITLTNDSTEAKVLELTSFVELSLTHPIADEAHPAFSKLFIKTEYDSASGCLVAGKRARSEEDIALWAAHSVLEEGGDSGNCEFETDRGQFIGRGSSLQEPRGIRSQLKGSVGSVSDPAFVMKRKIRLNPGESKRVIVVTSVGEAKEEVIRNVLALSPSHAIERTFQMAWNRGQIELHHLRLSQREAIGFQVLAGQIMYTPPLRPWREKSILNNKKGQSSLWPYGISGDRPIVIVRIEQMNQMPFVAKLLVGHEFLRRRGFLFDLVLFNESEEGYHQHLQESLQRAAEHTVDRFGAGTSTVYVINRNQVDPDDVTLILSSARIVLRAGGPSLMAQLRLPRRKALHEFPNKLETIQQPAHRERAKTPLENKPVNTAGWKLYNGYGGFSEDGKQYRIRVRKDYPLPAPWINVLANREFGCFVSELGTGYTWWQNSRECKITPWSNDPVLDPPGELGFIRDEETGEAWTVVPGNASSEAEYEVTHGFGYTRFHHERRQMKHDFTIFVPTDDPVKVMQLTLHNDSSVQKKLSVTYFAEWVLGVKRQPNAPFIVTDWDEEAAVLTARNHYQETFQEATAFLGMYVEGADDQIDADDLSWTGDRREFIGRNHGLNEASAMERERLSNRTGVFYESCGAVQRKLTLEPGESKTVTILLGVEQSTERVRQLAVQYSNLDRCESALNEVTQFWKETLEQVTVSTPSLEMDFMLNGWLLYQSLACRMWARTAFYQAGGAFGYRDQLQDSLSMLHTRPDMTKEQIILNASHQYIEGDVQHWWHEETERGIRTRFSDDLLWLPYAVARYVEHTGDETIMEQTAPYLTSELLKENEHERYEETVVSSESGTIYDHCLRAINLALNRIGEHGLPLIGVGDWNDGMNEVGVKGRGESVWLAWFLCVVLEQFADICAKRNDHEHETKFREARENFAKAVHDHGWDGRWYRRAFTDAGTWLGSAKNDECRIDAIAQSWSVISGAAPADRQQTAMQSLDQELVDRELNVVRLLTPPFEHSDPSPGYIQGYPPGMRENGAQYTHGVIWSIVAWSKMGKGDKAFELFNMLNPLNHTRTDQEVRRYAKEPYVMAADVYTASPHEGRAGWTWYTGAAGWMYQAGLEWILGIRRKGNELVIDPCIPYDWPEYSVTYRFGKTKYNIRVINTSSASKADESQTNVMRSNESQIDESQTNKLQPELNELHSNESKRKLTIPLVDDGKEHHVTLEL